MQRCSGRYSAVLPAPAPAARAALTKAHKRVRPCRALDLVAVRAGKLLAQLVQVAESQLAGVRRLADAHVDDGADDEVAGVSGGERSARGGG